MKILIATDYYLPHVGGIPSHIHTISQEFVKTGNEVCIIAPATEFKDGSAIEDNVLLHRIASLPTFIFPDIRFVPMLSARKIKKIIKEFKPDVVHVHFSLEIGTVTSKLAKKYGIPQVGTNHFMLENFFDNTPSPKLFKWLFGKFIWKTSTRHLKNADIITTPTLTATSYLKHRLNHEDVTALSNGVDFARFNNWKVKSDVFEKYGIPRENKIALFVGRLVKEKRIDVLIHSLPKVIKKIPLTMVIVGRGNWIVNYKNLACELGVSKNIIFADYLTNNELMDIYKSADVFIMPSIAELQSIATLEAMASGLPVVAANAGALPEIVFDNKNGYLFKPNNVESLTKNILKILSSKVTLKEMGRESVEIAKAHDIIDIGIKYQNLYQKAIAINLVKEKEVRFFPFYLSRRFAIRTAFVLFVFGVLFRNLLVSPTTAKAKTIALRNKIMNSKIVTKIENFDLNFKTQLPKTFIKKTN